MSVSDWAPSGSCAQLGPDVWDAASPDQQRDLCRRCPVLAECREFAAAHLWHDVTIAAWHAPRKAYVRPARPPWAQKGGNRARSTRTAILNP